MAKKNNRVETPIEPSTNGEDKRERTKADYVFEIHSDDGSVVLLGLTLHTPSEATIVKSWLETKKDDFNIDGTIRVCKKIYS